MAGIRSANYALLHAPVNHFADAVARGAMAGWPDWLALDRSWLALAGWLAGSALRPQRSVQTQKKKQN